MADAPEEERGARPPAPPQRTGGAIDRAETGFERLLAASRVVVVAPVIVLVASGIGAFAYGIVVFADSLPKVIEHPLPVYHRVGLFLVEIDLFLIGATLIIAAFGFYELFVSKIEPGHERMRLPRWLEMHDLNDLKARVISMLILVAAVTFVDSALDFSDELRTLYLGGGVGLFIAALTVYLRFGSPERRGDR